MNIGKLSFFHIMIWVHFPFVHFTAHFKILLNNLFCWFIFLWFLTSILMVIISLELTRVNLDRNVFSIKYGTTIYFFLLHRCSPSQSPNFKSIWKYLNYQIGRLDMVVARVFLHIFSRYIHFWQLIFTYYYYYLLFTNYGMVSYYVISRNYALITRK